MPFLSSKGLLRAEGVLWYGAVRWDEGFALYREQLPGLNFAAAEN